MRTLLILGGLVVCVLLVTPSNGDQTESQDGGGEKGTFDLREFFVGQNEGGISNGIGASSAIDQRAQPRPRRQEPSSPRNPGKRKKCPGCFSSLSVDDPIKLDVSKRIRRQEKKQEPSSPRNPGKRKKCPGCFSSLSVDDPIKLDVSKRIRRQEKKNKKPKPKPTKKPALPNMYGLTARSPRTKRDKKPKPSKKPRLQGTDGLERKPKSDRSATRKRNKSERPLPNMFVLMSAPMPVQDFSTLEKPPKDEGRRERKKNGRKRGGEEKEERKTRKHHHPHPEGKKEKKRKRPGSRSAIESSHIETQDLSDGKEVLERMKRQSDKGKKRREQKEKWRVGSRSPIAALPG